MITRASPLHAPSFAGACPPNEYDDDNPDDGDDDDDEVELRWAAIERLPTSTRLRTSLFLDGQEANGEGNHNKRVPVDVTKLRPVDRRLFIDRIIAKIEEDNRRLLWKLKERMDRVGLEWPTVEVRYHNLCVEAECEVVSGRSLPNLWNTIKNAALAVIKVPGCKSKADKKIILKKVSGIIKPSRMTLLLGPPGCGKTTLLQALAGKLDPFLKVTGDISYNGYKLSQFVPQKTSAYVSQYDQHIAEMTVRETLDFSARCQGVGDRADILQEVIRREKSAGIVPEPDVDTYMKSISAGGQEKSLQTDYILKVLGIDDCADTMVGDAMRRGISGGQKKRLTTGEMIIGPTRALFMDEISNGLDSSTTFQIVTCLQQLAHITKSTIVLSLLQPAPEAFDLFDDLILMAEGKIVYNGPRDDVIPFFETCGFRCPPRKGVADFLQEIFSRKDQAQYWYRDDQPYSYISAGKIKTMFEQFQVGKNLHNELSKPFEKSEAHRKALSFNIYTLSKWELLKVCLAREWLLMKRNSFIYVFKSMQLVFVALITMTMFIRTRMKIDPLHATLYTGSLFFALIRLMSNGIAELSLTVQRVGVFCKQRDFYFYPSWAYSLPVAILKLPFSMLDATLWTTITYYVVGYSPEPARFFYQLFLLFLVHQVSISLFRLIAATVRSQPVAATVASFSLLLMFLFGGFIVRKDSIPGWLRWGFWVSPLSYAEIGVSLNEFHAPRWQKASASASNVTLGNQVLRARGLDFGDYFRWISLAALLGFWILLNLGFTTALSYYKSPSGSRGIESDKGLSEKRKYLKDVITGKQMLPIETSKNVTKVESLRMTLPFQPMAITFQKIQYYVDTPQMLKRQGFPEDKIHLLQDITGAFKPGVLTALMGVSGAGKTTLMDVLSGRKTGGYIEGDIKVGGYPKVQKTYARVSGYCEQNDIHSPHVTIEESVMYSAWLRLSDQVDYKTRSEFVKEVLEMIELEEIKDALVGMPGGGGISIEQRKRLTIAVELVANPSIIFMDEPTTGLDARAAAIVMRAVKNIIKTNRTVVCTIHQPSIDVFEAFDELILMKRGGRLIYSGELGQNSNKLIKYLEAIPGVPKIKDNYNPATWMLEVTTPSSELQLGVDFAQIYRTSSLCQINEEIIGLLSIPQEGSEELSFPTRFPQTGWEQFKACLWKRHLSYWRIPTYNLGRLVYLTVSSVIFAALLWQKGQKIDSEQDFFNIIGSMFIFMQLMGVGNCSSVLPFVSTEREVVYRERFAGMYSSLAYSIAQLLVEIPYILLQTAIFCAITYFSIDFYPSAYKVFWYYYAMFCTLLNFNYLGLMLTSLTSTYQLAGVYASLSYTVLNLFSGYLIPEPEMPRWWAWGYWICPNSWSLKALLTAQYGDVDKVITVFGQSTTIRDFLASYYGYNHDDLGLVSVVLLLFPLIFAAVFTAATAKLNFQRR